MAGLKKLFADVGKLLYWGVGISDPGTIPRKVDLWKIAANDGWMAQNLSASNLNHKGKEAVRLQTGEGDGLAMLAGLQLPECKLDLSLAAVTQQLGLIVRAENEISYDLISFQVNAAATALSLGIQFGATDAKVELPNYLLGEWIGLRVVVAPQFTAVFVNGSNMPSLKVPVSSQSSKGELIGFWLGKNSDALIADLKYIQTKKRDLV